MAAEVAQVSVKIVADQKDAESGIKRLDEQVKGTSGWKGILSNAISFGGGALAAMGVGAAIGFVTNSIGDMVRSGASANRMTDILAQGLRSTHDASGQTVGSLEALSTKLMNLTGIDDDATKAAEQMLLTFTGIGKQAFPLATQAAADMATRMNGGAIPSAQQMQQQALLLGKALNDPLKGMTALTREGVTFTDAQKKQIETMVKAGDVTGAQTVMLQELQKEFGGSAEAAGHANGGIAILSANFDNMKQTVGQALIPVLLNLSSSVGPLITQLGAELPNAIATAELFFTTRILPALTTVGGAIQSIPGFLDNLRKHFLDALGGESSQHVKDLADGAGHLRDGFEALLNNAIIPAAHFIATNFAPTMTDVATVLGIVIGFVIDTVNAIGRLPQAAQQAQADIAGAFAAVQDTLNGIRTGAEDFWNDWNGLIKGVALVLSVVFGPALVGAGAQAAISGAQIASTFIKSVIATGVEAAKTAVITTGQFIKSLITTGIEAGRTAVTVLTTLVPAIITQGGAMLAAAVGGIAAAITGLIGYAAAGWAAAAATIAATWPILAIIAAIALLVGAISFAVTHWDQITAAIGRFIALLGVGAGAIGGFVGGALAQMGHLKDGIISTIASLPGRMLDLGKQIIQSLINGIRSFHIPLPHFSISGDFSIAPPSVPHLNIDWYAQGGIFTKPSIIGVGEDGPEAVVPLNRVSSLFSSAARAGSGGNGSGGDGAGTVQYITIQLDGRVLAESTVREMPNVVRLGTGIKAW